MCFNVFPHGSASWALEMTASPYFDEQDEMWASEEWYRDNQQLIWSEDVTRTVLLTKLKNQLKIYLEKGRFRSILTSFEAVAIGFFDEKIEMMFQKNSQ